MLVLFPLTCTHTHARTHTHTHTHTYTHTHRMTYEEVGERVLGLELAHHLVEDLDQAVLGSSKMPTRLALQSRPLSCA